MTLEKAAFRQWQTRLLAGELCEAGAVQDAVHVLHVLHAEDEANDAWLCQLHLEEAGLKVNTHVVASKQDFMGALRAYPYDLVLTDHKLRAWSGLEVVRLLKADGRDIACILLTGTVGEEFAVQCMKAGATDCVLKDRQSRLPFAIIGALEGRWE